MAKIISLANHKGGVGKTTSSINIGAALAMLKKRVLLIDLDSQANLTQSLGLADQEQTIYQALKGEAALEPIQINKMLSVIPSTLDLSGAELELSGEPGREFILRELLTPLKGSFDFILLDTPPSLNLLTVNALTASHYVLIPLQAEYLALRGLSKLASVIAQIQRRLNTDLKIAGVFITQYDKRRVLNRDVEKTIKEHFKDRVFDTRIRDNIALAEAPTKGLNIFDYEPKSKGALDYTALSKELLRKLKT